MKCPVDGSDLLMTDRQSIEIDYCPKCRGVWLDRGELDKIIERTAAAGPAGGTGSVAPGFADDSRNEHREGRGGYPDRGWYDDDYDRRRRHRKRRSFLEDLFDFD